MAASDRDIDELVKHDVKRLKGTGERRDGMNTMDKMLLILLLTALVFVTTVLVFNFRGIQVQDSLIQLFLGAVIAELASMGGIKIFKVRQKNKEDGEDT